MVSEEINFVGYEYKEVTVKKKFSSMYADSYENFGWKLESAHEGISGKKEIILKLKRNRKIIDKAELTRLQRQFESCMKEIRRMENSRLNR